MNFRVEPVDNFLPFLKIDYKMGTNKSLWHFKYEGATRISQCMRRVAPSAVTYPSGPSASDLTIHGTSCLKPIMTWINSFQYITKLNLEADFRSGRRRIVHYRKSMHGFASSVHGNAFVTS